MSPKLYLAVLAAAALTVSCTAVPKGLEPVGGFEPDRYLGRWYEIARLDHPFERDLINVSADYSRSAKGDILVVNRGFNSKDKVWKEIEGKARFLAGESIGSLKVSFFGPFYGGYHVIELDRKNYSYAMVTGPNRSYLWILSRSRSMDDTLFADLVSKANRWGFDTRQLIRVQHSSPGE